MVGSPINKLQRFVWVLLMSAASVALMAGCDDEDSGGQPTLEDASDGSGDVGFDFNRPDTAETTNPDLCVGKPVCTQEGNRGCSSSPQGVLECRRDADGCLVQTLVTACTNGTVCNEGDEPACGDACGDVSPDLVCTTEGERRCEGDTLQTCAENAQGCLVFDAGTDCTTQPGANACVDGGAAGAACGFDPCTDADDCTPGRTCTGASVLTLCEPDASGCLRETPYDCALVINQSICDDSVSPPVCLAPSNDPCEGVDDTDQCATPGTICGDGVTLERCAPNAFGCLVLTATNCATLPTVPPTADGYCDASSTPRCAIDTGDRCAGLTLCDPTLPAGSSCDDTGAGFVTCEFDAAGCFVEVDQETCTGTDVCNEDQPGSASCGPSCVSECTPGEAMCANNAIWTCVTDADADPCGEWEETTDCGTTSEFCEDTGSAVACAAGGVGGVGDTCGNPIRLQGAGSITLNTTNFSHDYGGYAGACTIGGGASAPEVVFVIEVPAGAELEAHVNQDNFDSIIVAATDCADLPNTCAVVEDDPEDLFYTNTTGSPQTIFLIVDGYNTGQGDFTLEFSAVVPVCGDGIVSGAEACDDANTNAGDGCAADCATVETGFVCLTPGQQCLPQGAGESCATPYEITANGTLLFNTSLGFVSDYSSYDSPCFGTGGGPDMVFSVQLDAGQVLDASILNETFDAILAVSTDCTDIEGSCSDYGDGPETVAYTNTTGIPQTVFLIADGYGTASAGAFNLDVNVRTPGCGDGVIEGAEVCDDTNTDAGDGCAADCLAIESGYICPTPGQACVVPGQGDSCINPIALTGAGTTAGNTATGGYSNVYTSYLGTCSNFGTHAAPDTVYSITLAPGEILTAEVIDDSFDSILGITDNCADMANSCISVGDDPDRITYTNTTGSAKPVFLVVDGYGSGSGAYNLSVSLRTPTCGDGIREGAEACDDTNQSGGDGCSADCSAVESGYICPTPGQACVVPSQGDTCNNPIAITSDGTVSANSATGGFSNAYGSYRGACATSGTIGGSAADVVYSVEVQPGELLTAEVTNEAFDAVLVLSTDCASIATSCALLEDAPERADYLNTTGSPQTVFLVVDGYSTGSGAFNLAVSRRIPACGDGQLDPGELCDDGNTTSGDGCTADCLAVDAGDTCDAPIIVGNDGLYRFNTTSFANDYGSYRGTCRTTGTHGSGAPDVIFAVDLEPGEVLDAEVINEPFDSILGMATDCADMVNSCVVMGDDPDRISYTNATGAPQTVLLVVDGYSAGSGAFDLQIARRIPGCGDGVVEGTEVCDDTNTDAGDGCAADCLTVEPGYVCATPGQACFMVGQGDTCDDPEPIGEGTFNFSTASGFTNIYTGYNTAACDGFARSRVGADRVFTIDIPPAATLNATLDTAGAYDGTLVVATNCTNILTSCVDIGEFATNPQTVSFTNPSPTDPLPVFLIADGETAADVGDFSLTVGLTLPGCGGGLLDPGEACDDGNNDSGDGCSADCLTVEPGFACPVPNQPCVAGTGETDPNTTCANALANGEEALPATFFGTINPTGDQDIFAIRVDVTSDLLIEVTDGAGGCPGDLMADLYTDPACTTAAITDDDTFGACPVIDSDVDSAAANLAPGTYYVRVRPYSGYTGPYVLTVTAQ